MLEESAREWEDIVDELTRATPELDELAAHLLQRWLCLVDDVARCEAGLPVPLWDADGPELEHAVQAGTVCEPHEPIR